MVVGELAPKNLANARPIPLARALSRSTVAYLAVAGPLIRLFDAASNRLLRAVGIEPVEELSPGATTEDLEHVIDESRKGGALDEELSLLLERGLAYRALTAEQAMTPRVAVDTAPATATLEDLVTLLRTSPHSRFPVVAEDVDDVVGVVGVAELLDTPRDRWGSVTVREACAAVVVVPGSLPLPAALEQLRSSRRQLAVVVDEFGGFDGVLSLEDIAEEVVGDIFDEGDEREPEPPAGPADTHTLSARLRLDEVEASTGIRLPLGADYATVSGLVLGRLGRVTRVGDTVVVDEVVDPVDLDEPFVPDRIEIRVDEVERHVPAVVTLLRHRSAAAAEEPAS
jgi:CBS domain containing-hemolysin-like protein